MDRTKNRSDRYQSLFAELSFSNDMMAEFAEAQGGTSIALTDEENEELLDLKDALLVEFWRLVDTELTERQAEVLHLCAEGLTQIEIAKKLKVNQSSITKSINGNCDYRNGRQIYGGSKRRLMKLAESDEKIKSIFRRMAELNSNTY